MTSGTRSSRVRQGVKQKGRGICPNQCSTLPSSGDVYPDVIVKISRDQYSAFEIKRMAEETEELMIAPPFQRKLVWNITQKRELVESILMGIPSFSSRLPEMESRPTV